MSAQFKQKPKSFKKECVKYDKQNYLNINFLNYFLQIYKKHLFKKFTYFYQLKYL
jgi:hypothetical protein